MVPRYARPAMTAIWEPEARFRIWFEIEAHATQKLGELGVVPPSAAKALWDWWATGPKIDVAASTPSRRDQARCHRLSRLGGAASRPRSALHAPGHDQLRRARHHAVGAAHTGFADILIADMDALLAAHQAPRHRAQAHPHHRPQPRHPCRTHHLRAQAGAGLCRIRARPRPAGGSARAEIATCAISGAVGTFANIDPEVEEYVAEKLGLAVEPVSTQVIPRDRHAMFFATLGVIASVASSASPPKSATCSAPKCWKPRNTSRPARRARRPCRTSATRC